MKNHTIFLTFVLGLLAILGILCFPVRTQQSPVVLTGQEITACFTDCRSAGGIYVMSSHGICLCSDNIVDMNWTIP